jgi:MFS family permease
MAVVLETAAPARSRVAVWRWAALAVAAAMVATLPGRTHGLGLITEPLLRDLGLADDDGRVRFAAVNLWATLLGALFCVPAGWLIDRLGPRAVTVGLLLALGGVVLALSRVGDAGAVLFLLVLLTRGLGQSALSVASLTVMGKAAGRRTGPAVGVYSFLTALGFMIRHADQVWRVGWRDLWAGLGWALVAAAPLAWLLVRPAGLRASEAPDDASPAAGGYTLGAALATPAFWVFALATSLYGLIAAGLSLFNQAILEERDFDRGLYLTVTTVTPLIGLASNLATGWLAARVRLSRLLAAAMTLVAAALLAFPLVRTEPQVYLYAAAMGVAGGMVTVLFFAVWGQCYGPAHLGRIQGAAQMLTVLASAVGPLVLAEGRRQFGSYVPPFQALAAASLLLGLAAWFVPLPRPVPVRGDA